jgi:peptide/nickel transport system substrate-binding protein
MPSVTLPKEYVPELQKNPDIVVNTDETGALPMKWVFFNLRKAPLSDKLVRHAIAYAIDREQILELAWRGMGKIGTSIVNSGMKWAFNPNLYGYPYDPQKANALLDKAGYPRGADGVRFKQRLHCIPARESDGRVAEIIKDQLKQVGIDIQIIATDRAAFVDSMFIRWDYDLAFQQGATAPDPAVGSRRFIHSDQIIKSAYKNGSGFSNPEVDYLLDQEVTEIDREKRAAMWHRIQEIFVEEVPMLPIYEDQLINVYRAEWADLITGPEGGSQTREHAYKKTE